MGCTFHSFAQQKLGKLTVEKIMRDPKWIGSSPSNPYWSLDGKYLFFNWNPDNAPDDSLYFITRENTTPAKATIEQKQNILIEFNVKWNLAHTSYVYSKDGDIFLTNAKSGVTRQITSTTDMESNPEFSFNETKIVYSHSQNLFAWDMATGETIQLTNLKSGASGTSAPASGAQRGAGRFENFGGNMRSQSSGSNESTNQEEKWLKNDQLEYFEVLRSRKEKGKPLLIIIKIYLRKMNCGRSI